MIGSIYSLQFDITGTFSVGTSTLNGEVNRDFSFAVVTWVISQDLGAIPVGANAVFDVLLSSDFGATWTTIFSQPSKLTISAGGPLYGTATGFALAGASAGDYMKCVCLSTGSTVAGAGLQVLLHGTEA